MRLFYYFSSPPKRKMEKYPDMALLTNNANPNALFFVKHGFGFVFTVEEA